MEEINEKLVTHSNSMRKTLDSLLRTSPMTLIFEDQVNTGDDALVINDVTIKIPQVSAINDFHRGVVIKGIHDYMEDFQSFQYKQNKDDLLLIFSGLVMTPVHSYDELIIGEAKEIHKTVGGYLQLMGVWEYKIEIIVKPTELNSFNQHYLKLLKDIPRFPQSIETISLVIHEAIDENSTGLHLVFKHLWMEFCIHEHVFENIEMPMFNHIPNVISKVDFNFHNPAIIESEEQFKEVFSFFYEIMEPFKKEYIYSFQIQ